MAEASIEYVPAEVLERLVDELTVDDVKRGRAAYTTEGDPMRGFAAVYFAAVRTGYVNGESEEAFLARVRVRDLTRFLAAAAETLPNVPSGGPSSPLSAGSGA